MSDKGEYRTTPRVLLFLFPQEANNNFIETFTPSQVRVTSTREGVHFKHKTDEKYNSRRKTRKAIKTKKDHCQHRKLTPFVTVHDVMSVAQKNKPTGIYRFILI